MLKLSFVKQFIKNPFDVGAIVPFSENVIDSVFQHIDFSTDQHIVELGAGLGSFTQKILGRMSKGSTLTAFEINSRFVLQLKKIKDERLHIIGESAEYISQYTHHKNIDVIVSTLPLLSLDQEIVENILAETYKSLGVGGVFIQCQYSKIMEKTIKKYFPNHITHFELLNFPPTFIYICKK